MDIEKGFYYHYKHDPAGEINNYAYEVMGIAHHSEIDGLAESAMVMYRPLYNAPIYQAGKHWNVRPRAMFAEIVTKNDINKPRFQKITDATILGELEKIRDAMYN